MMSIAEIQCSVGSSIPVTSEDATHSCSGLFGDIECMFVESIDRLTNNFFLLMCDFGTLSHAPTDKANDAD